MGSILLAVATDVSITSKLHDESSGHAIIPMPLVFIKKTSNP